MKTCNNKPFPLRFAVSCLPVEDCSNWKWIPSIKGISCLTEAELNQVNAGGGTPTGAVILTPGVQKAIMTTYQKTPDIRMDPDFKSADVSC